MKAGEVVPLNGLSEAKYCTVLCYPRCEQNELERRLKELKTVGVKAVEFTGDSTVFGLPVLGKGFVGVVAVAQTNSGKAALKIRRIDADRKGMFHEKEMLKKANDVNVGPKLLEATQNFLLMELIDGKHFQEWLDTLDTENAQKRLVPVLEHVLEQCYRLDDSGLDHGELSRAQKHIIVDNRDTPHLIDFETASTGRRVSNVTSVCQYLLLGSQTASNVREKIGKVDKKELVDALRLYKRERTRANFERVLKKIMPPKKCD